MKDSLTKEEKKCFEYLREAANNIRDYIERNPGLDHIRNFSMSIYPADPYVYISTSNYKDNAEEYFIASETLINGKWNTPEISNYKNPVPKEYREEEYE